MSIWRYPFRRTCLRGLALFAAISIAAMAGAQAETAPVSKWKKLAEDGLHDPANPGLAYLQEPGEALSKLPPDAVGNQVRWVEALRQGAIDPRANLYSDTRTRMLDRDVIMPRTGELPMVRFPHKLHTEWLDCSNCHETPFKSRAGATPVNMLEILNGEYCGLCHGAVSFPLTECNRCHSVLRGGTGADRAGKP